MATNNSGSRIFIDNSSNNLVLKLGTSGEAIELSSNQVKINNDIEILGNIINNQFNILEANVSTITSQININGVSFEGLPSDFATIADLCNINLTIDNLDQNFVLLSEFNELSQNFYALDAALSDYALDASLSAYALDASLSAYALDASLSAYALDASLSAYALDASLSAYALDASLSAYVLDASLSAYVLDASLSAYALDASLSAYALDASLSAYALDASLSAYALDASLSAYALDASLSAYALDASLSAYALDASLSAYALDASLSAYALDASLINLQSQINTISGNFITQSQFDASFDTINISGNFITRSQLDASFANINISGNFITRSQLDASFATINTNVSGGNFVSEASFNDLQNRSDNFFFFFKLKPWSLVYNDGSYSYPISNYGNSFSYNFGNFNNSHIDDFSRNSSNLQLFWKIPPRIFLNSTLNNTKIDFLPIYDNLIIEFREQSDNIWKPLINLSNFPDPSNNSGYTSYNNKNDLSMVFILNLTRNTANANDSSNVTITDPSFIIDISGGYNNFKNSEAYQFRIYLTNSSDLSNNFDKKSDQYQYSDNSINYLYFPDSSNVYFLTASRGNPKAPTNITFSNEDYYRVTIRVELDSTTADINNIISITIQDVTNNGLIFILDLIATKNSDYKKFIPYSFDSYIIDDISNNSASEDSIFDLPVIDYLEPEYTYDLSNYGMYFANDVSNISYANIDISFNTRAPLRNEVNPNFNSYISNYTLFDTDLTNYNSSLDFSYLDVKWRQDNTEYKFHFFHDSNSYFDISKNNLTDNLFNSLKTLTISSIYQNSEPKGIDFSDNSLCSFILSSQKMSGSDISDIYNPFTIDTSFNNFITTSINNSNNKYTFNYTSQDIDPNGTPNTTYSKTNGYYTGLVLNDICYNIDLNDFFNISSDLSKNDIKLKTKITQEFNDISYDNSYTYLIYKITDDLSQNITLDSSSSNFDLTYDESYNGIYFGLTSIKPHNTRIDLSFNGLLNNLSKYIRPISNTLASLNLKVSGSHNSNNNLTNFININWESNNSISKNINHTYTFKPLNALNSTYGTYDGVNVLNGFIDLTINDNIFAKNLDFDYLNLPLENGKIINISNEYFWDTTRIQNSGNFNQNNMIVFTNNPLDNTDSSSSGGTNYDPSSNTNSYIKYNQALYQNGLFYSGNNSGIYRDYDDYSGNDSNTDYSVFDNSGDDINYTINIPNWFNSNSTTFSINNKYKWVCFDVDLTSKNITSDNIELNLNNINTNKLGINCLFYIKIKYNGNLQIGGSNIVYSKWFDCLNVLNTGLSDSQRVTTNKSGIYNNNIARGTYPLDLIIPYFSSYATNLILLIGLNDLDLNIDNLSITTY